MTDSLFRQLFIIEMLYGALAFFALLFIVAPYGRHFKKGWGPSMPNRWAWLVQEFPVFILPIYFFIANRGYQSPVLVVFILIWELHYFHRTFIYPFRLNSPKRPYPVLLVIMAVGFNLINGNLNGYEVFERNHYSTDWLLSLQFIVGIITFIVGYVINKQSDRILHSLKQGNESYQVPKGGMFTYVSCPNYLGELIEWLGWAIMTWSVAGAGFFIFTFCNLFPRAISNHRWYKKYFDDYPKGRKAIIPFLV